jgi:hypothetical protein
MPNEYWFNRGRRKRSFSSLKHSAWLWGSSLLFSGYWGLFLWGLKQMGHEVDHSPLSNAEVKNEWCCTSTAPYAFVGCTGTDLLVNKGMSRHKIVMKLVFL